MENKFTYRDYNDLIIVYASDTNRYLMLNDVYCDFFRYIFCKKCSFDQAVSMIADEYDAPIDMITQDLHEFLTQLEYTASLTTSASLLIDDIASYPHTSIFDIMSERMIPFSATIEITDICNLGCVHCYRSAPSKTFWDLERFQNTLTELASMGTMHLTLTGGEPLCHPLFPDFLSIASQLGFVISVQTNATLLSPTALDAIRSARISNLSISLYSIDEHIHDSITGVPGSCAKTKEMIKVLLDARLRVSVNCPVMSYNKDSMAAVKNFCTSLNIKAKFALKIIPSQCSEKHPESLNIFTKDFIQRCISDPKLALYADELPAIRSSSPAHRYCQTGFRSITFDAQGNMLICNAFRKKCGSLSGHTAKELWTHSKELDTWRNSISIVNAKCAHCPAYAYCEPCPAHSYTQTGDASSIDSITCKFGLAFYDADHHLSVKGGVSVEEGL